MLQPDELIADNFAGGGGASTAIEQALGRPVDIAINHNPEAIAMHRANHPRTRHLCENVWAVDPVEVCAGRPVGLAWFSPDCRHFSKAKGGKPVKKEIRGLAWVAAKWAEKVRPRIVMLENVEEFQTWGPLLADNRPCPDRKGDTFRRWLSRFRALGYRERIGELKAHQYGAPTIRKRLFIVLRCDGVEIPWPEETHGPGLLPYRTAAECIDWTLPCPSIFLSREEGRAIGVNRPLADATMRRIARGVKRYVLDAAEPFIVNMSHGGQVEALVASYLSKMRGTNIGSASDEPLHTISANGTHHAEVRAFLMKYYGTDGDARLEDPLHTVPTKDRFGLVMVEGEEYAIVDIGMRMLAPRELFRAQGFPDSYIISHGIDEYGQKVPLTKTAQVRLCGNSVSPPPAVALIRAQFGARASEAAA